MYRDLFSVDNGALENYPAYRERVREQIDPSQPNDDPSMRSDTDPCDPDRREPRLDFSDFDRETVAALNRAVA